jgi:hypothetical protein
MVNQVIHGGDRKIFEVMTSTLSKGTLGSVASLLAATMYILNILIGTMEHVIILCSTSVIFTGSA